MFINTARGEVVDHAALGGGAREALRVGLDVFANEPASATAPFTRSARVAADVYGTHHIGASTDQAQEAIAAETVRIVRSYKDTGRVPNVVNLAKRTPATHMLVVRHRDRPGVLAHVFDHLREAQPERAGDREHRLRGRRGRRRPHQLRRRAGVRGVRQDQERQRRRARPAGRQALETLFGLIRLSHDEQEIRRQGLVFYPSPDSCLL